MARLADNQNADSYIHSVNSKAQLLQTIANQSSPGMEKITTGGEFCIVALGLVGLGILGTIAAMMVKNLICGVESGCTSGIKSFNCRKMAQWLDAAVKCEPSEEEYDHWMPQLVVMKKSVLNMTREEILQEAGVWNEIPTGAENSEGLASKEIAA